MIGLIDSIYETWFAPTNFNVLIVGHESVGKTTFFEQIKYLYNIQLQKEAETTVKLEEVEAAKTMSGKVEATLRSGTTESERRGTPVDSFRLAVVEAAHEAGLLVPASREVLEKRRIQPTVGLNFAQVMHRPTAKGPREAVRPSPPPPLVSSLPPPRETAHSPHASSTALQKCQLTLWDVGGQTSLRVLWKNYFATCQSIIFMVDSTLHLQSTPPVPPPTRDNQAACTLYEEQHQTIKELLELHTLNDVPFLILGNKCDVPGHLTVGELQMALRLDDIAVDSKFYQKWTRSAPSGGDSASALPSGATLSVEGDEKLLDVAAPPATRKSSTLTKESTTKGSPAPLPSYVKPDIVPATRDAHRAGFGDKAVKVMLISARTGENVAFAMDWMVEQLQSDARVVPTDH